MAGSTRIVTKALAGAEDLLHGEGSVQQDRAGTTVTLSKLRGFYPVNSTAELNALDPEQYPKAALVVFGTLQFFQYNGTAYEPLVLLTKTNLITIANTTLSALAKNTVIFSVVTPRTIDTITDGILGQELNLICTVGNTTIASTLGVVLKGGINKTLQANTGIRLIYTGTGWAEV